MGSSQTASKRVPAHKRVTGRRKTARKQASADPLPTSSTQLPIQPRPRARPHLKNSDAPVGDIPELDKPEEDANDLSQHEIADHLPADGDVNLDADNDEESPTEEEEEGQLDTGTSVLIMYFRFKTFLLQERLSSP